ncbi:MAG: hypothetical protein P4L84_23930 [Isosphaeraceae bacterium]|nr:hypothetical protein [Isosphaeraceae bacterium]
MAHDTTTTQGTESPRDGLRGWCVLFCALLPTLAAVWLVPWFVTQDGPSHLYNAEIIAATFDPESSFRDYFQVRWQALPNWAGHVLTAGLMKVFPPREADRVLLTVTLAGFAGAIVWLRARVAGERGLWLTSLVATLLGLNLTWLFGFTSFLLGACLFPITLGVWWASREHLSWGRVAGLAALLVLGYFCHLVSLGLTVIGVIVLALLTPGPDRVTRGVRTALALVPLVPLGLVYLSQSRQGGKMRPVWGQLTNPFSPKAWLHQLTAIDPITLASKGTIPLTGRHSSWFGLMSPAIWLALGLGLIALAVILKRDCASPARFSQRRGWVALAALLLIGGLVGPDSLGSNHGDFLPQRLILLGLVALLPALDLQAVFGPTDERPARSPVRVAHLAGVALVVALAVQSALVWEYALTSDERVGNFVRARVAIGRGDRVATLLNHFRGRFRVNPLLHADCLLGLDTQSIIWSDYETRYYYFPVQFRTGVERPASNDLEVISTSGDSDDRTRRALAWERLLEQHHQSIDALLVWGTDPDLDPISERWFEPVFEEGKTRVLKPRASFTPGGPGRVTSSPHASARITSSRSAVP